MRPRALTLAAATFALVYGSIFSPASSASPAADVRLSRDFSGAGYVSAYTLATGTPYTDATLDECSIARGRQNEPSVAADPRNPDVIIGSSNDYCGVFSSPGSTTSPLGPVWLGYYRSEDAGQSFVSSLVPGYPNDTSPFKTLAHVRTSDSGDPVIAWDDEGRVFMGSESSGDPDLTAKTFGDVWVARFVNPGGPGGDSMDDGLLYQGTETIARGSAAPNLLGVFNDKTAIEADRTGTSCRGSVYFAWARFTGNVPNGFNSSVYFSRSTDHGVTWSKPVNLSRTIHDIQFPDIAITGNGHVYVTFREFADVRSNQPEDAIWSVKSTNCGGRFGTATRVTTFEPYDATDIPEPEPVPTPSAQVSGRIAPGVPEGPGTLAAGDCGDFASHCASGYTFFRRATQVRSTADQQDTANEYVYIVYDPSKPGTQVPSGTTYGSVVSADLPIQFHQNMGSQSGIYFIRLDGATGRTTEPKLIDGESVGHQLFPDISADGGVLHALWWDSRLDPSYSPTRPIGNDAHGVVGPALDVWSASSMDLGNTWTDLTRVTDVTSAPNFEQFANRTVPFAGDYLWITSVGEFSFGVWTDWRDTVGGSDPREVTEDEDLGTADVHQCRVFDTTTGSWGPDTCPRDGGLDQNIYGDQTV